MPLLDHFHPPLADIYGWEGFHSNWATRIADRLNDRWLSSEFLAEEFRSSEQMEVDVATWKRPAHTNGPAGDGSQTVALMPAVWTPPAAAAAFPAVFPRDFEVRVFSQRSGMELVAAIELVSPSNKDRPEERRAFAIKCASLLHQGVSVLIVDIVTNRRANLHNEIVRLMQADALELPAEQSLYAVSYRPVRRDQRAEIDHWPMPLALGQPLPTMPLRLTGDLFVPVELDETYAEACRRRRIA